jgi:hypothetical protein
LIELILQQPCNCFNFFTDDPALCQTVKESG